MKRNGFEEMMEERRKYGRTTSILVPILSLCVGAAVAAWTIGQQSCQAVLSREAILHDLQAHDTQHTAEEVKLHEQDGLLAAELEKLTTRVDRNTRLLEQAAQAATDNGGKIDKLRDALIDWRQQMKERRP